MGMVVKRHRTINKHVSGGRWKGGSHAIEFFGKLDLTPKSTCVRKSERHIQHVVLIILWLWQKVIMFRRENNVARGAGNGTFASTCHVCKLVSQIDPDIMDTTPSKSISCSWAMERMSSPSLASTVLINCPFESRKCNLILQER